MFTAITLAKPAVHARIQRQPLGICIRPRHVGGRLKKWVISHLQRRFPEERSGILLFHRRVRIFARARCLEWISTGFNFAVQISGLSAGSEEIFKTVVMRFQFLVRDTPILNSQFGIYDLLAVTLFEVGFVLELGDLVSPALAIPVDTASP